MHNAKTDFIKTLFVNTPVSTNENTQLSLLRVEMDRYRRTNHNFDADENPILFWDQNKEQYNILSKITRYYLAIPPSQACVERAFSTFGFIYSDLRNRMDPDTLLDLLIHLRIYEFDQKIRSISKTNPEQKSQRLLAYEGTVPTWKRYANLL